MDLDAGRQQLLLEIIDLYNRHVRYWSSLPADVINFIGELLPLPDRIWFSMVCKSWYSAVQNLPLDGPWLLLPGGGPDYGEYTDSFTFYSVLNNTTFKCLFSSLDMKLSGMHCIGSSFGWLFVCDLYFNICLVNPLTGVRFELLPFSKSARFKFEYATAQDGSSVLSGFRDHRLGDEPVVRSFNRKDCYIQKIVFGKRPGEEDFCLAALYGNGHIASYSGSMDYWAWNPDFTKRIQDVVFYRNRFWAITEDAQILSFKLKDRVYHWFEIQMTQSPLFVDAHKFIVFDIGSRIYMILRDGDFQIHSDGKHKFHTKSLTIMKCSVDVFKDFSPTGSWEPVEDLNGESIFIGNTNGLTYSLRHFPMIRRNCVYITSIPSKDEVFDMGVYDMEQKKFELFYPNDMELNWAQPPPILLDPLMMKHVGRKQKATLQQNKQLHQLPTT